MFEVARDDLKWLNLDMSQEQPGQGNLRKLAVDKERMEQINMMRRSAVEAGKFDNSASTSAPMALSALVGLGFEFAFYLLVLPFKAFEATQLIPAYFYERGWVPFVLTYLAGWSCAILLFKYRKLKTQRAAMLYKLLPDEISKDIRVEALPRFEAHIKRLGIEPSRNFLINRILRGLEHFGVRKNHTETADMLSSQSEIDATMVDSSYTTVKVFIWAIPILGFIGTVLGISTAVSSFDLESAKDVEAIQAQLGAVTGGLSEAFDTTLISLIFSLCVMFPTSLLQKAEEDILNQVDDYCNEYLLKRLREPEEAHPGVAAAAAAGDPSAILQRIEELQQYLLQVQHSQAEVAGQMTDIANHYATWLSGAEETEGEGAAEA